MHFNLNKKMKTKIRQLYTQKKTMGRSPSRLALLLIPLALARQYIRKDYFARRHPGRPGPVR
jgi:hypothetical protein